MTEEKIKELEKKVSELEHRLEDYEEPSEWVVEEGPIISAYRCSKCGHLTSSLYYACNCKDASDYRDLNLQKVYKTRVTYKKFSTRDFQYFQDPITKEIVSTYEHF